MTTKNKIGSGVVYAVTASALGYFFDSVYGAGPVPQNYNRLLHIAIAGALLLVIACLFSLFSPRVGAVFGLIGCILSWPLFAGEMSLVISVWRGLFSALYHDFAIWRPRVAAALMLIASTIYSLNQVGSSLCNYTHSYAKDK